MFSPNPAMAVILASSSDPVAQAVPLVLFLFIGALLTFFFVWFGKVNTRLWFYLKYQRRRGFAPALIAMQLYAPDWVTVGFWPSGFILLMVSVISVTAIGVISQLYPDSRPGFTGFLLILLFLPGLLYVFAIVIKFFYNMLVHGAAMQDDAATKKAEEEAKAGKVAALKAALSSEPADSVLNQYRRYWLACFGDDPAGNYLALIESETTEPQLWSKALQKCRDWPGDSAFKERVDNARKRRAT